MAQYDPTRVSSVFTAKTVNDSRAIQCFCKVQFAAFQTKKQIILLVISLAMIVAGATGKLGNFGAAILLPFGCFTLMFIGAIPKSDADKVIQAYDGKFPTSKYSFGDRGIDIEVGSDRNHLDYESMIRLIEDKEFLLFFASPKVAYLIDKESIRPKNVEHFKEYTQKRVGVEWTKSRAWYMINMQYLMNRKKYLKTPTNQDR